MSLTGAARCGKTLPGLSGGAPPCRRRKGNPMTFVSIDEKHTEEALEKKEKKLNLSGAWEIRDLFDGIDGDLRLSLILNGRL